MNKLSQLKGHRILFIGIGFYDYDQSIIAELKKLNKEVSYFSTHTNIWNLLIFKRLHLNKISEKILKKNIDRQINRSSINNDIIFVIKGENFDDSHLIKLKLLNPNAIFILYLWDDLHRLKNLNTLNYFDKIWSFDRVDCLKNKNLSFRPLFYREKQNKTTKNIYISFIGGLHSDRLEISREIKRQAKLNGKSYYIKLYTGIWLFIKMIITGQLRIKDLDIISILPISYNKVIDITRKSKVVLDVQHPSQYGLTMRSIEAIESGCILLTTNKDLVNYSDIPKESYIILDREHPVFPNIINASTFKLSDSYSLKNFLKEVIFINEN